jgi:DegV family protein with EDD domain
MAIRIITDSTSDISFDQQQKLGIEIVSLSVRFGNEEYLDGVDLTKQQFYSKLSGCDRLPATSQVNPEKFAEVFKKYTDQNDEVLGIFISSKLSGTFQSAEIAKKMLDVDNIYLIDSKTVTLGLALLVYQAVKLRDEQRTAAEIHIALQELTPRVKLYAVADTLKYLKMGGRLTASAAFLGTMLHIKPIISISDGKLIAAGKKKGLKAAAENIAKKMQEEKADASYPLVFGSSNAPEMSKILRDAVSAAADTSNSREIEIGAVVGTHAGPGCAGVAYILQE